MWICGKAFESLYDMGTSSASLKVGWGEQNEKKIPCREHGFDNNNVRKKKYRMKFVMLQIRIGHIVHYLCLSS